MRDHILVMIAGIVSLYHAVDIYMERQTFDLMACVLALLSVIYFVSLMFDKEEENV